MDTSRRYKLKNQDPKRGLPRKTNNLSGNKAKTREDVGRTEHHLRTGFLENSLQDTNRAGLAERLAVARQPCWEAKAKIGCVKAGAFLGRWTFSTL